MRAQHPWDTPGTAHLVAPSLSQVTSETVPWGAWFSVVVLSALALYVSMKYAHAHLPLYAHLRYAHAVWAPSCYMYGIVPP